MPGASPAAWSGSGAGAGQGVTLTNAITTTTTTTTTTASSVATRPAHAAPSLSAVASLVALRKAVEKNDLEGLQQAMAAHPDSAALLNQLIPFPRQRGTLPAGSYTLLMLAAARGHAHIVTTLLGAGADVDARGSEGNTALMLAVDNRQLESVEALLKGCADVDAQAHDGNTAVMLALARRDPATVSMLLTGVASVHNLNGCLRQAALRGHVATVQLLLKAGADVNSVDDVHGKTATVPPHGNLQGRRLGRGTNDARYDEGRGAWNPFAELDWADSLALVGAARNGHASTVRALLAAGARVERGFYCQQLMLDAVASGHLDIARMLMEARRKAPVDDRPNPSAYEKDCVEKDMRQAFICTFGSDKALPVLQALLTTPEGRAMACTDPLVLACAVRQKKSVVVRALLDAGADPDKSESDDQFPIVLAIEQRGRDILEMLINAGARPGLARRHRNSNRTLLQHAAIHGDAEVVKFVLSLGADARGDRNDVNAALLNACGYGNSTAAAQLLLDAGADLNWTSDDGRTPLYEAAQWGLKNTVALLLEHKAQPDHVCGHDGLSWTPLMVAAANGRTDTVRLLLEAGASRERKDDRGRTALRLALDGRARETADLLRTWTPPASS
jgi:ankyrin repeat protein